jgi:hypothetical protein
VPRLCWFYPGICLTTEEKHGNTWGAPISCFRSPGGLNFGRRRLIVVGTHRGTCCLSHFWYREFWHVHLHGSGGIGLDTSASVIVVTLPAMVMVMVIPH